MRAISEIAKIFRKEKPQEVDKKFTANQVWGIINGIVKEKDSVAFQVTRKLRKDELPPDLREWKHYDEIGDSFGISVSSKYGLQQITIITGAHYLKLVTRGPEDIKPMITEGRKLQEGSDVPLTLELNQEPLDFAHDLARFIWVHWSKHSTAEPEL